MVTECMIQLFLLVCFIDGAAAAKLYAFFSAQSPGLASVLSCLLPSVGRPASERASKSRKHAAPVSCTAARSTLSQFINPSAGAGSLALRGFCLLFLTVRSCFIINEHKLLGYLCRLNEKITPGFFNARDVYLL